MRRNAVFVTLVIGLLGACAGPPGASEDIPSWKAGASVEVITAAPDAGGPLSWRNCPTLSEARAAVPIIASGPDANGVPFKTMILQCGYGLNEPGVGGGQAAIWILVFDASAMGASLWASVRTDPAFPNATDIAGLAEVAFSTGSAGHYDLWVVHDAYGFHMYQLRQGPIPLDQMVALARAMLTGLARLPR